MNNKTTFIKFSIRSDYIRRIRDELINQGYANLGPKRTLDNIYLEEPLSSRDYITSFLPVKGRLRYFDDKGNPYNKDLYPDVTAFYYGNVIWTPINDLRKIYIGIFTDYLNAKLELRCTLLSFLPIQMMNELRSIYN